MTDLSINSVKTTEHTHAKKKLIDISQLTQNQLKCKTRKLSSS